MAVIARCLRGIEWVCAVELQRLGARVRRVEHRLVECETDRPAGLLASGTADDLFLLACRFAGVDHRRAALADLRRVVELVDAAAIEAELGAVRPVPAGAAFEVVASFLGRRNYHRSEIEDAIGRGLARATGRRFLAQPLGADEHPPLSWRAHLFDGGGVLGLRLPAGPLHRRAYRTRSVPGALRPTLACAAAMLGGPAPGATVLDPFCGTGTMLLEAARLEPAAWLLGVDADRGAVAAARANAADAGVAAAWAVGDAGRLAVRDGAADLVLTNPPWGRAVGLAGSLAGGVERFWAEAARVTAAGGRVVALAQELEDRAPAIRAAGLEPALLHRVAVSGAWATLGLLAPAGRTSAELDRLAAAGLRPPADAG